MRSVSVLSLAISWLIETAHAQQYAIEEVAPLASGDESSEALAINNVGQVLANSYRRRLPVPFLWSGGATTPLIAPDGTHEATASALNDSGVIIGQANDDVSELSQAVIWSVGKSSALPIPIESAAQQDITLISINSSGVVLGEYFDALNAIERGFVLDGQGAHDLGLLSGTNQTSPGALASDGSVYGSSILSDDDGASSAIDLFVWNRGQISTMAVSPSLTSVTIEAANSHGQIIGTTQIEDGDDYADRALIIDHEKVEFLGTFGGTNSYASAINEQGVVVGTAEAPGIIFNSFERAFIWQRGTLSDLNEQIDSSSDWYLQEANGINECGQIVGVGFHHGKRRGFVITPITHSRCSVAPVPTEPPGTPPEVTPEDPSLPSDDITDSDIFSDIPIDDSNDTPTVNVAAITLHPRYHVRNHVLSLTTKVQLTLPFIPDALMGCVLSYLGTYSGKTRLLGRREISETEQSIMLRKIPPLFVEPRHAIKRGSKRRPHHNTVSLSATVACAGAETVSSSPITMQSVSERKNALLPRAWLKAVAEKMKHIT